MLNFSIGVQIEGELKEFESDKIRLASLDKNTSVRLLKTAPEGYYFNQLETINLIDLYFTSHFENSEKDGLGQTKIFMNIGKFRTEVSAKQIDIDVKDFRFLPDDYANPWTATFLQKEFKEWAKESIFGELVNQCVDNLPKYGSVVLKKVGKELKFVPLQVLRNEQTAKSLKTANYVIEEHPDMYLWELQQMKGWNLDGLKLKYNECVTPKERYGYVPLKWLKENDGLERPVKDGDENVYVDALVIACQKKTSESGKQAGWHIFFAGEIKERPYREAHWNRQHGRWLGLGVMEDLIQNQKAKNIIVNLVRRSLHWSSKRAFQSTTTDMVSKNLVKDVEDGEILEVGTNGQITEISFAAKTNADFGTFLNEWEKNADQKAFTYEIATGESLPSGTPFRLGVVLSNAVNSFFAMKREKLGIFLKQAIEDFLIPQFLRDMGNQDRVIAMFSGEEGFQVLKEAAMDMVRAEAAKISMFSGEAVDAETLSSAVRPFDAIQQLFFKLPKDYYQNAKYKFDLTITGEEIDLPAKIETLKTIYTLLAQKGDPRADKVLDRIAALSGENMALFGLPGAEKPTLPPGPGGAPSPVAQANAPQPIAA